MAAFMPLVALAVLATACLCWVTWMVPSVYVVVIGGVCPNLVQTKKSPQPMRAEALGSSEVKSSELGKATAQND